MNGKYLVQIKTDVSVVGRDAAKSRHSLSGEMHLSFSTGKEGEARVAVSKLGLSAKSLGLGKQSTGAMSMSAKPASTIVKRRNDSLYFEIQTTAEFASRLLGDQLGFTQFDKHLFKAPTEEFRVRIRGVLRERVWKKRQTPTLRLTDVRVAFRYEEGGLGLIRKFEFRLKDPRCIPFPGSRGAAPSLGNCDSSLEVFRRRLRVLPVGFRTGPGDLNPTGASAAVQFAAANAIWGKCCIEFDVQPIHLIDDAMLKTSSNTTAIRDSYTDPDPDTIEVYFVDNPLVANGGGTTSNFATSLAKIVMTDDNAGNPNLLAHEIGHVLSAGHPGFTPGGTFDPDANTVMEPSGSAAIPNDEENTHWNCINADNPSLVTTTMACCLTHDIPDHLVKDFPEDGGAEPNPGFPGRNFYSMSNVWNRTANAPGLVNADGTTQHQNPARFEMDGVTPHTNYLFAKVDALHDLRARDVEVRFYLKHPGSGGGAANVVLLGTAPLVPAPAPTTTVTVSIAWEVPAGTPGHSCVFAGVHSPAEPAEDITALPWADFETLVRADNDWAQRNLDIENVLSNIGNTADGQATFNPIIIHYPRERGLKSAPLSLVMTVSKDRELIEGVEISIPNMKKRIALKPGRKHQITVAKGLNPGTELVVVCTARLDPSVLKPGEIRDVVSIDPVIGELQLAGYTFQARGASSGEVIHQMMDGALAALQDYAEITGSRHADLLSQKFRDMFRMRFRSPELLLEHVEDLVEPMEALVRDASRQFRRPSQQAGLAAAFQEYREQMHAGASPVRIYDAFKDFIGRLQMVNYFIYR